MAALVLAIDAVGAKHGGAATVLRSVVEAVLRSSHVERVVLFTSRGAAGSVRLPQSDRLLATAVESAEGPFGRIWWHGKGLAKACRQHQARALLCLSGGGFGGPMCPTVLFIQQSLPFEREALQAMGCMGRLRVEAIRRDMRWSARRSVKVIVQTQTMKSWVAEGLGIAAPKIAVIEPDVDLPAEARGFPRLEHMRTAARTGPVVLYVGNASPHKNLGVLGPAMRILRTRLPAAQLFGTFPEGHPLLRGQGVQRLPLLGPAELREAYECATVLVMPSLVETVGLPMLEAAANGRPVVAADRPYAREVCGAGALFFDPRNPESLAIQLERVMLDGLLRRQLSQEGRANAAKRASARPYDQLASLVIGTMKGGAQ